MACEREVAVWSQSEIKFGSIKEGSTISMLKNSKLKILNNLAKAMEDQSLDQKFLIDGIEKVLSGNFAFIAEDTTLNRYKDKKGCQIYQVGDPLVKVYQAFGLQKSRNLSLNIV